MTRAINLVVLTLATRRLTHLIVDDKITEPAREALFQAFSSKYWLRYLLTCTRCTSVWSALVVLMLSRRKLTSVVVVILALSEASIIIDEAVDSSEYMDFDEG